jgi:ribonuclease P protein subunit POP4
MTSSPRPGVSTSAATPTTISHPAHTLLERAHSPDTASRIFTDKVRNKPLLLQPTSSTDKDKRALRRHVRLRKKEYHLRKRKPRPLSAKEKRTLGVFELRKEEIKYEIYQKLHDMWNGYMLEVLGYTTKDGKTHAGGAQLNKTVTAQGSGSLLASADFHGALVEVVRAKDVGKVGCKGIVVRDTRYTFVLVTEQNEVKTVPKKDCVFRYGVEVPLSNGWTEEKKTVVRQDGAGRKEQQQPVDDNDNDEIEVEKEESEGNKTRTLVFELHGNQFEFRPAERASRKFKWKVTDYL